MSGPQHGAQRDAVQTAECIDGSAVLAGDGIERLAALHLVIAVGLLALSGSRLHGGRPLLLLLGKLCVVGVVSAAGAGMGMKSPRKRRSALPLCSAKNFEAGILTDEPEMLEAAIEQFDNVWIGKFFASSSINAAKTVAAESIVQTQ